MSAREIMTYLRDSSSQQKQQINPWPKPVSQFVLIFSKQLVRSRWLGFTVYAAIVGTVALTDLWVQERSQQRQDSGVEGFTRVFICESISLAALPQQISFKHFNS